MDIKAVSTAFAGSFGSLAILTPDPSNLIDDTTIDLISNPASYAQPKKLIISLASAIIANLVRDLFLKLKAKRKLKREQKNANK